MLIIDFPDERVAGGRKRFDYDHMHAWFTHPDEAHALRRRLDVIGGNHLVVDGIVCPVCGQTANGETDGGT